MEGASPFTRPRSFGGIRSADRAPALPRLDLRAVREDLPAAQTLAPIVADLCGRLIDARSGHCVERRQHWHGGIVSVVASGTSVRCPALKANRGYLQST